MMCVTTHHCLAMLAALCCRLQLDIGMASKLGFAGQVKYGCTQRVQQKVRSLALHCIRSSVIVVQTSAINMLVGLLEPSGGTALIEGHDTCTDMASIYAMMGVCPQHDLLWETLTGREHLLFYGRLKNLKVCSQVCMVFDWPCLCCRYSVASQCLSTRSRLRQLRHCFRVCNAFLQAQASVHTADFHLTAVCCTNRLTRKLHSLHLV